MAQQVAKRKRALDPTTAGPVGGSGREMSSVPQRVRNGFEEVVDGEWFFEGSFDAEEGGDFKHLIGQSHPGHRDERELGKTFAEIGEGFDAFAPRHEEVDDGQIDGRGGFKEKCQALLAILGDGDGVAGGGEDFLHQFSECWFVVHYKNMSHGQNETRTDQAKQRARVVRTGDRAR